MAAKQCFFLGLEGSDSILYHKGLAWLFENAKETGGWLAVNGRENIGGIARHPGLGRFAIFHNKNVHRIMIADCMIELVTRFSIPAEGLNKPLLAIHPTTDYLNALDAVPDVPKMMVIPWIAEEADAWAKKSFAMDFDNPELPSIFLDNVAVTAFKHLKFAFTESPPTSPVQYRTAICQTIHILIENGLRFEPAALESALVQQCGWGPVSAKHAAEIAEIFLAGQTPAGYDGTGPWNSDIIKLWKIEAKKTT